MPSRQQIETWTAVLSAATAAGCVLAHLCGVSPRSFMLLAAEAAAATGVVSLLLSAPCAWLLQRMRAGIRQAVSGAGRGAQTPVDYAACLQHRREVLDARLAIDEPHLCSQYAIACTCWSFCASTKRQAAGGEHKSQLLQTINFVRKLPVEAQGLPIVHRSGMAGCQFRFAAR
jgi:hypothetical protein